jgi:signal transduction histidine kinase
MDSKGQLIGIIGVSNDITERKTAELKLAQQNKELIKTNSELDRFVYSVSHDLRAPLSSMLGIIEISLDVTEEELIRQHLSMLKGNVKKLDGFIGDILDYSRNARMEVKNERIIFADLLNEIKGNLKYMGGAHRLVDIKIELNDNAPVFSDKTRLSIVLNNLISNAIRYQNQAINDPFVKIQIDTAGNQTVLTISDNGIGIRKEYHEKIFDMFYRVSEASVGSGLGLYIVKEAITKIDGVVELQSEPGKGSIFIITIPNN